jgi:hypothetical protein
VRRSTSDPCTKALFVIILSLALSGCADTNAPTSKAIEFGSECDGGELVGVVTDGELNPVADANVSVDAMFFATTAAAGDFVFPCLPVGSHTIAVQARNFLPVSRSVDVGMEDNPLLRFTLERSPVQEPFVSLTIYEGYSICDVVVVAATSGFGSTCNSGKTTHILNMTVDEPWKYGVFEMAWQSLDSFIFWASDSSACLATDPCWALVRGRSPLRMEAAPADKEVSDRYRAYDASENFPEGKFELNLVSRYAGLFGDEINQTIGFSCTAAVGYKFGCLGIGMSSGIRFTTYSSIFYWGRPTDPGSYSGMPDG